MSGNIGKSANINVNQINIVNQNVSSDVKCEIVTKNSGGISTNVRKSGQEYDLKNIRAPQTMPSAPKSGNILKLKQ